MVAVDTTQTNAVFNVVGEFLSQSTDFIILEALSAEFVGKGFRTTTLVSCYRKVKTRTIRQQELGLVIMKMEL